MTDTEPQTAEAEVRWPFTMPLDGFVAGPNDDMARMAGVGSRPGLVDEHVATTGAVLAGRHGFDSTLGDFRPQGGAWADPIFVLTHHPDDARPAAGISILGCPVEEAARIALDAAGGKNVEVFSPTIGRQLLDLGLVDEIDLHIAPVLLGSGSRLYATPGGKPVRLHRVGDEGPMAVGNLRYRPSTR